MSSLKQSTSSVSLPNAVLEGSQSNNVTLDKNHSATENTILHLPLYNQLDHYEQALNKLVSGVDSFKPNLQDAQDLIEADKMLVKSLEKFPEYDEINRQLLELRAKKQGIDDKHKKILLTLNDCYTKLNTLPMVEQVQFENEILIKQRAFLKAKDVLDYAMKLSKFTKVPPTFDKGMIGPINFIWPGDDSLRRGMLAMADVQEREKQSHKHELSLEEQAQIQEQQQQQQQQARKEPAVPEAKEETLIFDGKHKEEPKKETQENTQDNQEEFGKEEEQNGEEQQNGLSDKEQQDEDLDLELDLFNPDEF
ncbi:hypothetical protein ACO0QE_003459 [Hanseniaspora vineae]